MPRASSFFHVLVPFEWRCLLRWCGPISSTRTTAGFRAITASISNSSSTIPPYSTLRRGIASSPITRASGLSTTMRLYDADYNVFAPALQQMGRLKHCIGLSNAGGIPEEDLQSAGSDFLSLDFFRSASGSGLPFLRCDYGPSLEPHTTPLYQRLGPHASKFKPFYAIFIWRVDQSDHCGRTTPWFPARLG